MRIWAKAMENGKYLDNANEPGYNPESKVPRCRTIKLGLQKGLPVIPLTSHMALITAILDVLNPVALFAQQIFDLSYDLPWD